MARYHCAVVEALVFAPGAQLQCYPRVMTRSAAEVLEAALALPEDQRAEVAEKLLASLDGEVDANAEAEWGAEIERRLARIEAGQSKAISMGESVARLHRIARGG